MTPSLIDVLYRYLGTKTLRSTTQNQYQSVIRNHFGDWLHLPLDEITGVMVVDRHRQISETAPGQANLAMRILRALYSFADVMYEEAEGEGLKLRNPVMRLNRLGLWNQINRRQGRILEKHLPEFWRALELMENEVARDWLKVLFFTGLRRNEVATLAWAKVDMVERTFTVTRKHAKNKCEHVVPMSRQVYKIFLERFQCRTGPYVFGGRFPDCHMDTTSKSYQTAVRTSAVSFCPHDLRRGFMSTAAELNMSPFVIKKMMNHSTAVPVGSDTTLGYFVADVERLRTSFQAVADELERQAKPKEPPAESASEAIIENWCKEEQGRVTREAEVFARPPVAPREKPITLTVPVTRKETYNVIPLFRTRAK